MWYNVKASDVPVGAEFFAVRDEPRSRCRMIEVNNFFRPVWRDEANAGRVRFYLHLNSNQVSWTSPDTLVWLCE